MVDHAQHQHCNNRAHGTQGHKAEAVVRRMAVAADCRDTDAKRHDKGYCHGARGNAAGIKCHGKKILGNKIRQNKHRRIEAQQHMRQRDPEQHTQKGNHEKTANPRRNRKDQHHIGN